MVEVTEAIAHLKTAIANIDLALREENYIRPSRQQKTTAPESYGSCVHCRKIKARCDGCGDPEHQTVCSRCQKFQLECTYSAQGRPGRKAGASKRSVLLTNTRKELVAVLAFLDPSSASPASSSSPQPSVHPSYGLFSQSSVLSSAPSGASTSAAPIGQSNGLSMLPTVNVDGAPAPMSLDAPKTEDRLNHDALDGIDNPLEVLAHVSLKERSFPTTIEASAKETSCVSSMNDEMRRIHEADAYYASGLYKALDDTGDGELDPVNLAILTERDLRRLVNLYFTKLRRFFFHLDEKLHTPDFLRNTSPFLTTAIAYIVATLDPESAHLIAALKAHVDLLAARVFSGGYKSVEIVQGFLLLQHWSPPAESWCLEEAWKNLGEALRIATEIRLDRPMDEGRFDDYRAKTPMTAAMLHALRDSTLRTWHLLWSANLMLSVHSGRVVGKSFIGGLRDNLPKLPPGHEDYALHCNELLNRILANALNLSSRLHDKPLRDSFGIFNRSWRTEIEQWHRDWPAINHFMKVRYSNVRIMLLSLSLRFTSPSRPILAEVQTMAVAGLKHVTEWAEEDDGLIYASNSVITNIAYGATLLLKIISTSDPSQDPNLKNVVLDLCSRVVDTLLQIGKGRVNGSSHAVLQAARMQSLIRKINSFPTPAAAGTQEMGQGWALPVAFPSPSDIGGFQAIDFTTDSLFQNLGGDHSGLFENFSSSGLLSTMGDDQWMSWTDGLPWLPPPAPVNDGSVQMQAAMLDFQVHGGPF